MLSDELEPKTYSSKLSEASSGEIDIEDGALGYVFQDATLLPWRTVQRNVELLAELAYERAPLQYFYTRQRQLLGLGHAILNNVDDVRGWYRRTMSSDYYLQKLNAETARNKDAIHALKYFLGDRCLGHQLRELESTTAGTRERVNTIDSLQ